MGSNIIPKIMAIKGNISFLFSLSLKIVNAMKTENMISPLVRIDPFMAVDCFSPKKYDTSPETSAIPIPIIISKFLLPIFEIGPEFFLIGVKKIPLIR